MLSNGKIYMALGDDRIYMEPSMCNRHGFISGASGTGKTVTLKVMAESFSAMGVPVFLADIKGDLSGMCEPGVDNESMQKRMDKFGIRDEFKYQKFPTRFWDVFGKKGVPVRAAVSQLGPEFLSRLLELTDAQQGVLEIIFRVADENQWFLDDLKDLRAMLLYCDAHKQDLMARYGNITTQSIGVIQRALLSLEREGGDVFLGQPSLDIYDWMRTDYTGKGYINVFDCVELSQKPNTYATFMLWLMTELYENLPEVGDLDKPRIVFFFDEAHMLFRDAPKALVNKIEMVIKLIRSKGVGIFFISQSPSDVPDTVLAQLSNRVQHALRAYTPSEQKAVRIAAETFRPNPAFKTEDVIQELGVGEALVSFLDEKGVPGIVQKAAILPPESNMSACAESSRNSIVTVDEMAIKYKFAERTSAYEILTAQAEQEAEAERQRQAEEAKAKAEAEAAALKEKEEKEAEKAREKAEKEAEKAAEKAAKEAEKERKEAEKAKEKAEKEAAKAAAAKKKEKSTVAKLAEKAAGSAATTAGRYVTNSLLRGIFGNLKK